jgi:hypothetical protein
LTIENRYLFNFSASYSSGGYKRLYEYAKWFNAHGGAWFVVHPNCRNLETEFAANRFFVAVQTKFKRLFDDCAYLEQIEREIGQPDLYYSYGIPAYRRFGAINWFHLSNVLPLWAEDAPLSFADRLKFRYLGWRIRRGFANADVISAESANSLRLIELADPGKLFLSVNGSDDELDLLESARSGNIEDIAAVVGTYRYKALHESVLTFDMLKSANSRLKLIIFGNKDWIPRSVRNNPDVDAPGIIPRAGVIECLRRAKFYISTTYVENSYNAASEGIFCAAESYISDIGPHRELLMDFPVDRVAVPGLSRRLLHVKRADLSGANLKSWDTVIGEMIGRFRQAMAVK